MGEFSLKVKVVGLNPGYLLNLYYFTCHCPTIVIMVLLNIISKNSNHSNAPKNTKKVKVFRYPINDKKTLKIVPKLSCQLDIGIMI